MRAAFFVLLCIAGTGLGISFVLAGLFAQRKVGAWRRGRR